MLFLFPITINCYSSSNCFSLGPTTSPEYKECDSRTTSILLVDAAFSSQPFGHPFRTSGGNVLDLPESKSFDITLEACEKKKTCTDKTHNCNLPQINYKDTCRKARVFKSPYAECMRKIQKQAESVDYEPSTDALDSLFNDYTNYGLARKCVLLNEESRTKALANGILKKCGEKASDSFSTVLLDLKLFFDC